MNKSAELKTTTEIVHEVLRTDEKARNSDNYLYYIVCGIVGKQKGIDINSMSMPTFFLKLKEYGFPGFETVRRSRQKLQAEFPELAASADVEAIRVLNEEVFRGFARGD